MSVFHLIILKFEVKLWEPAMLLVRQKVKRAYFLPIFSNGLAFGTDNPV